MTSSHEEESVRIFHKECVSLARAGYDVYLVEQGDSYDKNGVHIVGVGQPSGGRLSRMTSFAKKVYQVALTLDADIYHFHDPELLPYGLKLKKVGKKVIFDSHEHTAEAIVEKRWISPLVRWPAYRLFSAYQRYVVKKLDAIVTVTPHMVDYFLAINPKTEFVANYPVLEQGEEPIPHKKEPAVVFAGGISKQWNHDQIIKAVEQIPECRYCLLGSGEPSYLEQLKSLPGWDRVDFIGRVPHTEVADRLKKCVAGMAVLTPGRNTGHQLGTMGNTKIFEEMMAGLPVICTDFILWKEFVERYHCGICIDPENVEQIAEAIRYLLDHPEEARQMGENGRRAVKEEFNWSIEEKKLLALYKDILKNN